MKKSIFSLLALALMMNSFLYAGRITKVYEFASPALEASNQYSVISFEGTKLLGEPGKAILPFYPVKLLLPQGEIASSIEISYEMPVKVQGNFRLMPFQGASPVSSENNTKWLEDKDFYITENDYPGNFKPHLETQFYNGCGIALSAFTPVRYNPAKGQVVYYQRVVVTIHTKSDPEALVRRKMFYPSEKKSALLSQLVQNPEEVTGYYADKELRSSAYDYLIITGSQYLSEFDTLINFYKIRGISAKVVSTAFISSDTTGADIQEKIRNYICGQYQSCGIDYVLIGGDIEIVNFRGFYCFADSDPDMEDYNIPADLYYSALDGNWNTDGDNKWGEPNEDDLYPEVGIGRLTFSDSVELHNMIHKIIKFQGEPVLGELSSPLLSGEWLYGAPLTYGSTYMNLLVGYHTDNGYSTHGIPPAHPRDTLYDKAGFTFTKAQLIAKINSGHPYVHHTGHANYNQVMRMGMSDITNPNFSQVNGVAHNYTNIYTHGCICGGFDYADCIAEKMIGIDNLAVSFVGNSRYGWFNQGTSDGPSEHLHREFMDALYYDSLYRIGMTHLKSKSETAPFVEISGEFEPGATRWCFYDNNVLGDPAMALWTNEPYQVEADFPGMVPIGVDTMTVHITGNQGICRNFTCSIYRNDTLFGAGYTNAAGTALIHLTENVTEGPVFLVVSGYNILPQYFTLEVCDYWLGYTSSWDDPFNWFSGTVPDNTSSVIIPADPAGNYFPTKNVSGSRQCKAIYVEPGATMILGNGETLNISGN